MQASSDKLIRRAIVSRQEVNTQLATGLLVKPFLNS